MAVCKFFLQGSCRFGDGCRNEHPGSGRSNANSFQPLSNDNSNQRGRGRGRGGGAPASFGNHQVRFDNSNPSDRSNNSFGGGGRGNPPRGGFNQRGGGFNQNDGFSNSGSGRGRGNNNQANNNQPPNAPRGRGRGFQGRGPNRQNDVRGPADNYKISTQGIMLDVTDGKDKPNWVCSCYAPGEKAPLQLIEGDDLEISPEELRIQFYLDMANGQNAAENAANTERMLSEEMAKRVNAIYNDPEGAMQYIINGINEHPNRFDMEQHWSPKPGEVRWGQFTRDKQRRRQGVFADQPPSPKRDHRQPARQNTRFNQGGFQQPQTNAFGQPQQSTTNGGGFGTQQNAFGQSQTNNAFGRPTTPFGQQQQPVQDEVMMSPTRPAQPANNGFGQSTGGGFFSNPGAFAQAQPQTQPAVQPQTNGFGAQPQRNAFGQPQSQPNAFGQSQPQTNGFGNTSQPNSFGAQPQAQPNGFGASQPTGFGASATNGFGQPQAQAQPQTQNNGIYTRRPVSTPAERTEPLTAAQLEAKKAYEYAMQNGSFPNGIMPEMAPEDDWIS